MKRIITLLASLLTLFSPMLFAQETFSIVAVDTATGEVGSAGASCVDLEGFNIPTDDFIGELVPGTGAINTQAFYQEGNQQNARNRMLAGDTPDEIIQWLINNDVQGVASLRQYGIAAIIDGQPQSAGFTGTNTQSYKNHITGSNYAIQGNILLGQEILDSMEARFLKTEGDLACKLMAAMQGANVPGADTRCASNNTSSLFAFLKVAQPTDTFGAPSFLVSVRTPMNAGVEPIDSLQTLFDAVHSCVAVSVETPEPLSLEVHCFPNPAQEQFSVIIQNPIKDQVRGTLYNLRGEQLWEEVFNQRTSFPTAQLPAGIYLLRLRGDDFHRVEKIVIE